MSRSRAQADKAATPAVAPDAPDAQPAQDAVTPVEADPAATPDAATAAEAPDVQPPTQDRPPVEGDPDAGKTAQASSISVASTTPAGDLGAGWNTGQRAPYTVYEVYDGKGWGPENQALTDEMEPGSRGSVFIAEGDTVLPRHADRIAALGADDEPTT